MSNFPAEWETHGGEDVTIYASGPMAHLFTGTHEQTFIAHGMAYAACVGENQKHCQSADNSCTTQSLTTAAAILSFSMMVFL